MKVAEAWREEVVERDEVTLIRNRRVGERLCIRFSDGNAGKSDEFDLFWIGAEIADAQGVKPRYGECLQLRDGGFVIAISTRATTLPAKGDVRLFDSKSKKDFARLRYGG